jgi:hypothetical protein
VAVAAIGPAHFAFARLLMLGSGRNPTICDAHL